MDSRFYIFCFAACFYSIFVRGVHTLSNCVPYHISERDIPSGPRELLIQHFLNLTFVGEYWKKQYDSSCLYPLETNRFAPADCIMSPRCGSPRWEKLTSTWYGQEWGVCYGSPQHSVASRLYKMYSLNSDGFETFLDGFRYDVPRDVLTFLREFRVGVLRGRYYLYSNRCLSYMPSRGGILPDGIRFHVDGEELRYHVMAVSQFHTFCGNRSFSSFDEMIKILPIYINQCPMGELAADRLAWVEERCDLPILQVADGCYCSDDLNPVYSLVRGCEKKEWHTMGIHFNVHYSNPLTIAFKSVFTFLWHEVGYILEFVLTTFFSVIGGLLLAFLDDLVEFCRDYNIRLFEGVFVAFITYCFGQKFILCCIIGLMFVCFGLII